MFAGLIALSTTAQTSKNYDGRECNTVSAEIAANASTDSTNESDRPRVDAPWNSELEHQQLRELLASQSTELQATREQLRQLQQRMESLESEVRSQRTPSASTELAVARIVPKLQQDAVSTTAAIPAFGADNHENTNSYLSAASGSLEPPGHPVSLAAISTPQSSNHTDPRPIDQEYTSDSIQLANGKIRIGTLLYGDFAYYFKSGFGPQFTSQANQPGPGNNGYNTFQITRAYINLFYSPGDAVTFRLTPDIYRQIGAAPATKIGKVSAIAPNTDQGLPFRLKYAYVDLNTLFTASDAFKKDKLTIGQQQDALINWEDHFYDYRFANLMPWDYLGYASAWAGVSLHGPVEFHDRQYLDYSIGVYNNASYRLLEQSEKKHAAARLTAYPFGARSNYDGLGFTAFYDYGYTNVAPDTGVNIPIYRISTLAHYTFKRNAYAIAGEFEMGRNALTSLEFFSGSAPQDEFGLATTQYAGFDALVKALQNENGAKQRGYVAFGRAQIRQSPFTLFGLYHSFSANTNVSKNPIDFERIVAGISYKASDRLRFALSSQNLVFRHSQFTFPAAELQSFDPSLAAANPNGIANAVPGNVQAIFVNSEFAF
jgi:hypothetical protein